MNCEKMSPEAGLVAVGVPLLAAVVLLSVDLVSATFGVEAGVAEVVVVVVEVTAAVMDVVPGDTPPTPKVGMELNPKLKVN